MAIVKRGRAKRLVLDIGTSAIRICELVPTKAGFQLTRYYQRELNIDPVMEEEDKAERRYEVLRELLKEAKIRSKKTIIAVPGQSVFTRNRPLPPVPEYKVTQIVKYEIQQQIPFSLDQIALDYQVLGRTEAGGYDVMMAAIKVDVVEKQLEILRKTRRRIDVVDVSPIAAYNWLRHTGEFGDDGQCVALLDMGATTTDIVIQKDSQFKFTRSLHIGGNDITTAIAENFNMSFEDAERLKREKGFAPTGDPKRDGRGGEVIGRVLARLVGEVNRSFAYFRSQPGGGPVTRVIVTGGSACLKNIIPFLQSQLRIDVRIAQPLAGIAVSPKANEASEHPEQACVVLGLALRCCQNVPIQINLIPPRVLEVARRKEQVVYWVLSLAAMNLIVLCSIPLTDKKDDRVQEQIKDLRSVLAQYDAELIDKPNATSLFEDDFQFVKSDIKSYKLDVTNLDNLRKHRNFWLPYIQAINDARPPRGGIALSSIETGVIGGADNTGAKARGKATNERADEEVGAPLGQASVSGGATGGSKPGSRGASLLGGSGGGGSPQGQGGLDLNMVGFPGLGPSDVVEPNGFTVYGYAKDINTVREFVESLKERDEFVEGGVYWDKAFSNAVPEIELDQAKFGGVPSSGRSGSGGVSSSGGGSSPGGGRASFGGGGPSFGGGGPSLGGSSGRGSSAWRGSRSAMPTGEEVTTFRLVLQFLGDPEPQAS